jgi:hypothetical protein
MSQRTLVPGFKNSLEAQPNQPTGASPGSQKREAFIKTGASAQRLRWPSGKHR